MIEIIVTVSAILLLLLAPVCGIVLERKSWNFGKCPKCDTDWKYFDTDSQGGRGYKCSKCNRVSWISYPYIDKSYNR